MKCPIYEFSELFILEDYLFILSQVYRRGEGVLQNLNEVASLFFLINSSQYCCMSWSTKYYQLAFFV